MGEKHIEVKLIACNARTRHGLAAEMGVDEDMLTESSVTAWSDTRPDEMQPRYSSLVYFDTDGLKPCELVLVPYGKSFTMLGIVRGDADASHPIEGVVYKKPLLSMGVLR